MYPKPHRIYRKGRQNEQIYVLLTSADTRPRPLSQSSFQELVVSQPLILLGTKKKKRQLSSFPIFNYSHLQAQPSSITMGRGAWKKVGPKRALQNLQIFVLQDFFTI